MANNNNKPTISPMAAYNPSAKIATRKINTPTMAIETYPAISIQRGYMSATLGPRLDFFQRHLFKF
ncbi:hypothetical protein ACVWY5_004849 [Bradyrhizobium sp. USDA 3256]